MRQVPVFSFVSLCQIPVWKIPHELSLLNIVHNCFTMSHGTNCYFKLHQYLCERKFHQYMFHSCQTASVVKQRLTIIRIPNELRNVFYTILKVLNSKFLDL